MTKGVWRSRKRGVPENDKTWRREKHVPRVRVADRNRLESGHRGLEYTHNFGL